MFASNRRDLASEGETQPRRSTSRNGGRAPRDVEEDVDARELRSIRKWTPCAERAATSI